MIPILPCDDAEGSIGAACRLSGDELRERLGEWRKVGDQAVVEEVPTGVRLTLDPAERLSELASLIDLESDCCDFYRFTLSITGISRVLTIEAEYPELARQLVRAA